MLDMRPLVLATLAFSAINASLGAAFLVSPTAAPATARRQSERNSRLYFGPPTFQSKKEDAGGKSGKDDDKKIGLSGLLQLITAGAGSPFLGDYQGIDKETGNFMFSLEANNLVDEQGRSKQTQMPYFESGWVDPKDEAKAKQGFKWPWQK